MTDQNRPRTVMESDDEIRAALLQSTGSGIVSRVQPAIPPEPDSTDRADAQSSTAKPYRPTLRPPVPLLVVCDDGGAEGEVLRLRNERFTIGRTGGDFLLPHDGLVSARHVEIIRVLSDGRWRWLIADLKSTHGVYFRFTSHQLFDKTEFLVGRTRFRFEQPNVSADLAVKSPRTDSTIGWGEGSAIPQPPTLVEVAAGGGGRKAALSQECWIGADPACQFAKSDDPFLEPQHAKVFRHPKRGWVVENNKTQNGVWVRRDQYVFDPSSAQQASSIRFQVGEQQFRLSVTP